LKRWARAAKWLLRKSWPAAEDIDQAADNLAAALKDGIDRGLAQDIRDRVVQIFEACNFQDLTSQRVTKVMTALKEIEAEIASALAAIATRDAAPAVQDRASKATTATPRNAISTSNSTAPS
jgi:chemotaxis regulatin CheY-phosphate phosphatase CheZ